MRQLFLSALDLSNESNYVGGIIPSLFATNITNDKSLSLKLKKKKKLLAQYSSKHARLYQSFCPDVLQSLLDQDEINSEAVTKRFMGALMSIDLSGFTRMSADLCKLGNTGLDDLRHTINRYFGRFVDTVRIQGGDVLHFAGDALICVFPTASSRHEMFGIDEDSEPLATDDIDGGICSMEAVRCAFLVNECCRGGELQTHTAIAYGEIFLSALGGHENIWTYVVNGHCVDIMGSCLDDAQPSEVVLSAATYHEMSKHHLLEQHDMTGVPLPSGNFRIDTVIDTVVSAGKLSPGARQECVSPKRDDPHSIPKNPKNSHVTSACVVQFIPRPVLEAISANLLSGLSELRTVTCVFMKLDNYKFVSTDTIANLQIYFYSMQQCLSDCGGFLRQFLVDDKGCVLIGLWGVPTSTYSNNCSRALRCAVTMQRVARGLGHTVSIGIATGRAYCGTVGSMRAQDYVALGRSVNLSARLMSKSNGGVYLDQTTFEHLPLEVSGMLGALPAMNFKGFTDPLICFEHHSLDIPPEFVQDTPSDSSIILERYVLRGLDSVQCTLHALSKLPVSPSFCVPATPPLTQTEDTHQSETRASRHAPVCLDPHLSSGRPHFFVVKGSPGVGKTAVATYLSRRCKRQGFGVLYVKANASDDSSPYSVIARLLVDLIGGVAAFGTEALQREVIHSLLLQCFGASEAPDRWALTRFPVLRKVLGLTWEMSVCKDGYYNRTFNAEWNTVPYILSMLLSQRSLLVVIDNAHFMCRDSWSILLQLSQLQSRSVIVLTLRVDDDKSDSRARAAGSRAGLGGNGGRRAMVNACDTLSEETNTLGHMSHIAVQHLRSTLLAAVDDEGAVSPVAVWQDHSSAAGDVSISERSCREHAFTSARAGLYRHQMEYDELCGLCYPLLLTELHLRPLNVNSVKTLLLKSFDNSSYACEKTIRTVYRVSKGSPFWCWKIIKFVKSSGKHLLKFDHQLLMGCVLDKFTDAEKNVIKCASVIGEEFSIDLLVCILAPFLLGELDDLLLSLIDGGVIFRMTDGVYSFRSSLVREFTYSLIPPTDAAMMHQSIASCIEYLYKHQLHAYTLSLSYHYSMSSWHEREKALYFSSQAAVICFSTKRHKEGTAFVKNCLRFVLTRKDILGLLLVVECGVSHIDDYVKTLTTLQQSQEQIRQQGHHEAGQEDIAGVIGHEGVAAGEVLGQTLTLGVLTHRQQLLDIRKRLCDAYMSLGPCTALLKMSRLFQWLWERVKRREGVTSQVHAIG